MNILKLNIALLAFLFLLLSAIPSFSGASVDVLETDSAGQEAIVGFFDLRDRETFMQVTNVDSGPSGQVFHIQLFNVADNCNENDFFDAYTPNDTHVYNLRDIKTNDGNPAGVVLPDGAYGIFVAYVVDNNDPILMGNMRILDDNGYEYRTNLVAIESSPESSPATATFNFNTKGGVTLSDIVGFVTDEDTANNELLLSNVVDTWWNMDVDIFDLNENAFSCRKVIFSCVNEEHPLLEELLETVADDCSDCGGSVASFEYGINNAIPHSKGGELLCPGNNISEGFVRLDYIDRGDDTRQVTTLFIGLNNGNGRGSMDTFFMINFRIN